MKKLVLALSLLASTSVFAAKEDVQLLRALGDIGVQVTQYNDGNYALEANDVECKLTFASNTTICTLRDGPKVIATITEAETIYNSIYKANGAQLHDTFKLVKSSQISCIYTDKKSIISFRSPAQRTKCLIKY